MNLPKIRLGDRVRHATRPELGEGRVWELRPTCISVRWASRPNVATGQKDHGLKKCHYKRESLVKL